MADPSIHDFCKGMPPFPRPNMAPFPPAAKPELGDFSSGRFFLSRENFLKYQIAVCEVICIHCSRDTCNGDFKVSIYGQKVLIQRVVEGPRHVQLRRPIAQHTQNDASTIHGTRA